MWTESDARKVRDAWDSYLKWSDNSSRLMGNDRQKAMRYFLRQCGVLNKFRRFSHQGALHYADVARAFKGHVCLHCKNTFTQGNSNSLCSSCKDTLGREQRTQYRVQGYAATCQREYGVDNLFQRTDLVRAGYQRKHGSHVDNPMDVPCLRAKSRRNRSKPEVIARAKRKARKTCMKNWGAPHHMQSKAGLQNHETKLMKKFGVPNVMLTEHGRAAYDLARGKFLADPARVQASIDSAIRTNQKRWGCENPMHHPDVQERQKEGLKRGFAKYGGHPMYDDDIKRRALNSKFAVKSTVIDGIEYSYQGYEDVVLRNLVKRFGHTDVYTQYTHDFRNFLVDGFQKSNGQPSYYMPDLYVRSKKCYVEVKSIWTLEKGFDRNQRIQDTFNSKDRHLLFVVVRGSKLITLPPKKWSSWSLDKTRRFLLSSTRT